MIKLRPLPLPGVIELIPDRFSDPRGLFCEVWNGEALRAEGINIDFVQDNHSVSRPRGVLRGLHYQLPPFAQDKLVRVVRGAIFDVAVDIRPASPTFRQWTAVTLSAADWNQLLVPAGYAHGFVTLEPDTEVIYKVSRPYSRAHERAIRYDDPDLAIDWPVEPDAILLSDKDQAAPPLSKADLPQGEEIPA
jgi:dTDP-4-dehydrorhamnose 3,5-epimerase